MELQDMHKILVTWRGKQFSVVVKPNSYVKELGEELQELTNVKRETLRLFVPHPHNKGSKVVMPFSDSFSSLTLQEAAIIQGKPIRMMGVSHEEIEEVSQDHTKPDLRIIGFDEEEKRLRQRAGYRSQTPLKLPQGPYIFCEFRALHIPGIELNPPPSEALRRLHILACDPGIIAIMNKHRWRVGVMTEMAPEGYVGISPKCILGFNKNQGEEISLRLRTDDLKGFRKYEGIKKTLLHELAHMVHSEHDSNFFALNKQLNDEAAKLDWTKSQSHMLSGQKSFSSDQYDDFIGRNIIVGHKLGGTLNPFASARSSSAAAAVSRLVNASNTDLGVSEGDAHALPTRMPYTASEPDPDVSELTGDTKCRDVELDLDNPESVSNAVLHGNITAYRASKSSLVDERHDVPDPYDSCDKMMLEPEPDDSLDNETMLERDPDDSLNNQNMLEPDPDDSLNSQQMLEPDPDDPLNFQTMLEPDPDDSLVSKKITEPDPDDSLGSKQIRKPDPDGSQAKGCVLSSSEPDPDDSLAAQVTYFIDEPDSVGTGFIKIDLNNQNISEPDPDDSIRDCTFNTQKEVHHDFESHNSELLQTVAEPAATVCSRIQKAVNMLRSEATPPEAATALQTLFKIIRNVIEHPGDTRFKRLRKANPQFQRNVANYKAAMEVLTIVGFCEDVVHDEIGRAETFMVLKRNDPGLLWLAKSSIEMSIA